MSVSWQILLLNWSILGLGLHEAPESDVHSLLSAGCKWWCEESWKGLCVDFIWHDLSPLLTWFSDFCNCNSTFHLVSPFFLTSTTVCLSCGFISCSCLVLLLQPFSSLPLSHHRTYQTHTVSSFAVPVRCSSSELPPSVPCKCQPLNLYLVSNLQAYNNNNNKLHTHVCTHVQLHVFCM